MFYFKALASLLLFTVLFCTTVESAKTLEKKDQVKGILIEILIIVTDWKQYSGRGYFFTYIEATEGTNGVNPSFSANYDGAGKAKFIRGAYHKATIGDPSDVQANWFASHGGDWSNDGITLPGAVCFGCSLSENDCSSLGPVRVIEWIHTFFNTYHSRVGRYPVIFTETKWWNTCTNGYTGFGSSIPLWLEETSGGGSSLPSGWKEWTFLDTEGGNDISFSGTNGDLTNFAHGTSGVSGLDPQTDPNMVVLS